MKVQKRMLALLLVLTMTVMAAAGCGGNNAGTKGNGGSDRSPESAGGSGSTAAVDDRQGTSEEIFDLDMILMNYGTTPSDIDAVEAEINKITEKEIGVRVNLVPMGVGDMTTQLNLILSGSEKLDLVPVIATNFANYVSKGQLLPMDEALAKYGQDIIKNVGEAYLKAGQVDGNQYGVTTCRDNAKDYGIMMRKDLAEKYGVDFDKVDKLADFEPILKAVKEGEDGIVPLVTLIEKTPWYNMYGGIDPLGDYLGVLLNNGKALTVENLFTSEDYREFVELMRDWYLKGYIQEDASTASTVGLPLLKAGRAFAYLGSGKPGGVSQAEASGCKMKWVQTRSAATNTSFVQMYQWCIPKNCENIDKTMQFLNMMYTNSDIVNLLAWGIEGKHYVVTEDGHADYPEGVDASNTGWGLNTGWLMGNQFLSYVWVGNELTLWDEMKEFNNTAEVSKAMGFTWDATNVKTEIAACTNVMNQYRMSLECGMVDPDSVLPEFQKALEDAGINKIIAEKQAQLDAWSSASK